jgi:hypothetical protein
MSAVDEEFNSINFNTMDIILLQLEIGRLKPKFYENRRARRKMKPFLNLFFLSFFVVLDLKYV